LPVFLQLTECRTKRCSHGDANVPSTLAIERRIQRQKLTEAKRRKKEAVITQADLEGPEAPQDRQDSTDDDSATPERITSEAENDTTQDDRGVLEEDRESSQDAMVVDEIR
jgi:hypothetical protein